MLDLAIVHRPGFTDGKQDIGRILEAMLYYDRVHLVLSGQLFPRLWDQLSVDDLATLLNHPGLTSALTPEMVAVRNDTRGGVTTHAPIAIQFGGNAEKRIPEHDDLGILINLIERNSNRSTATRAELKKVLKRTKISRYAKLLGGSKEASARFYGLARDPETLKLFLRGWANAHGQQIDEATFASLHIEVIEVSGELMIAASHPIKDIVKGWTEVSEWGNILTGVQDYAIDLYLSSSLSGDILTTPEVDQVAAARLDLTIQRATRSANQISAFEEMVFEESHGFAHAFNSGLIDLVEALTIIDQSRKFRTWTRSLAPDASLLAEYHREITRETALKRFPLSVIRFGLFNFAGWAADAAVAPGSGIGLSAIDSFVVDRLISGWRPNVFVRKVQRRLDKAKQRAIRNSDE